MSRTNWPWKPSERTEALICLVLALFAVLLLILSSEQARGQEIFWARSYPSTVRHVWIHGRELWVGPEMVKEESSAALEQVSGDATYGLTFNRLHGANGQDANRGLPYCQRFSVSPKIPHGEYILRWRRNDGKEASVPLTLPAVNPVPVLIPTGEVCYLDAPMVIDAGAVVDLGGCTYIPSEKFPIGKSMVVVKSGATLQNGQLICPEGSNPDRVVWVDSGKGTLLRSLNVVNMDAGEIGLFLRSLTGGVFENVSVRAWRCCECNPGDSLQDNTFALCRFSGISECADSQIGRGVAASNGLVFRCGWASIDRGPTLSPQGASLSRMLFWECEQRNTGVADGASEGLLIECKKLAPGEMFCFNQSAGVKLKSSDYAYAMRPGYVLAMQDGSQRWAYMTEVKPVGDPNGLGYQVTLDRKIGTNGSVLPCLVGNAAVENSFIRCRFSNGKSGIWLWGASINNAIVGCDFRDLEWGILTLLRNDPPANSGFSWGLTTKYNRYSRVKEPMRVSDKQNDWLNRPGSVVQ